MNKTVLYPTDLTDEQWALLRRVLPPRKRTTKRGRPPADLRRICNGLLYSVRAGGAWRLLPRDFGPNRVIGRPFTTCCAMRCAYRQVSVRNPPPRFWTARPCARQTRAGSEATTQPRKPRGSSATYRSEERRVGKEC